jgi:flavin-dependent dehydrogenase
MRADAVVVGAGPAGATTALLLRRQGHRVLLLDRARFPRDKLCGEHLSPDAVRHLDRLGALAAVERAGARPVGGMRVTAPDGTVLVGDYPASRPGASASPPALAVRRRVLDATLLAQARAAGAVVREGFRVTDVTTDGARVTGVVGVEVGGSPARPERIEGGLVVGADGRASVVAARLGLRRAHPWLRRLALVADVAGGSWDAHRGEIVVAPPVYVIANPVGPALRNVSVVLPAATARDLGGDPARHFDRAVEALPRLRDHLRGARRVSPVRALAPLAYTVRPPRHDGVILVGDALGFLDPFTGEGVCIALRSAELAAEVAGPALADGDLSAGRLAPVHDRRLAETAGKRRLALLLQVVIARRALAVGAARLLARRPAHLRHMMGVIGDRVPPGTLLAPRFLAGLLSGRGARRLAGGQPT